LCNKVIIITSSRSLLLIFCSFAAVKAASINCFAILYLSVLHSLCKILSCKILSCKILRYYTRNNKGQLAPALINYYFYLKDIHKISVKSDGVISLIFITFKFTNFISTHNHVMNFIWSISKTQGALACIHGRKR
jgi:hypothetical protein